MVYKVDVLAATAHDLSTLSSVSSHRCCHYLGAGGNITGICDSVCPHSKGKMTRAINTKLGKHAVHSDRSANIDPEVKRSKVKVMVIKALPPT